MTTRREFIQGVIAGVVALVLPKTAKGGESDEPIVEPEDGTEWSPEITGDGSGIALPEISSAKLYGPGYIDWIHFPEYSLEELAYEQISSIP